MSSTYRIHGARFLRKYTADEKSSIYAYMADVRRIADTLCKVSWERASRDIPATMTLHTEEGLDWNAPEREHFDAAEWCAEHADDMHRAYAQAACYVFEIPTADIGKTIEKIAVQVTSDPYNPYGARISALTSNTLSIPMACADCREGEVYWRDVDPETGDPTGMGAAPRLYVENEDGTQTWYANSQTIELTSGSANCVFRSSGGSTGSLTAKKYLFVFCILENYNRGRNGWIEGCSFIENNVSLTLSAASSDLDDDELNDLAPSPETVEFPILSGGVLAYVGGNVPLGYRHVVVRDDSNPIAEADGAQTPERGAPGVSAASALSRLYAAFYGGEGDIPSPEGRFQPEGAKFVVARSTEDLPVDWSDVAEPTNVFSVDASALVVPFVWPTSAAPSKIRLSFSDLRMSPGAKFNVFLAGDAMQSLTEEQLKTPGLWDGGEGAPFQLLGTITRGSSAEFVVPSGTGRVGTIVITGWLPPEAYSLATGGTQGTDGAWGGAFLPDISILGIPHS